MFVLKNRNAPQLSEADSHAQLSRSKQWLKNIHPIMLSSFCSLTKTYLPWLHRQTHRINDCTHIRQPTKTTMPQSACAHNRSSVTDYISRRVTSGWHYISLIFVDQRVKVSEEY